MFTVLFDILKFLKLIQCIVWQKKNYFVQTEFVFKTIVGYKKMAYSVYFCYEHRHEPTVNFFICIFLQR